MDKCGYTPIYRGSIIPLMTGDGANLVQLVWGIFPQNDMIREVGQKMIQELPV